MTLSFHPLTLTDRDLVLRYTWQAQLQNCDLSFANLYAWQLLYQTEVTEWNDFLLFRFQADGHLAYLMPLGNGNWAEVIELLHRDACTLGHPLLLLGVTDEMKHFFQGICSSKFFVNENREHADYIYLRASLESLAGKKLQPKRNHINKFKRLYPDYKYLPLTEELVPLCLQLDREWSARKDAPSEERSVSSETVAIERALGHLNELNIIGGCLFVEGKLVAFTYGAAINDNTFDVCVEKADTMYEGVYAMINNEFVKRLPGNFTFINREEDLGIEGLRKAKLSYMPHQVLMKYSMWSSCSLQGKCGCVMRNNEELHVEWQTRALWKLCFGDADNFLDLFFAKKYQPQNNTFVMKDGKMWSAVQRLPYTMSYAGMDVPIAYLAGACTLPEQRGKGLMTDLLAQAHRKMYQEGRVFSLLIPADEGLAAFYAHSGYTICSEMEMPVRPVSIAPENLILKVYQKLTSELCTEIADFVEQIYRRMPAAVLHDASDMCVVTQDLFDCGGKVLLARNADNGRILGVIFAQPNQQGWVVKECLSVDEAVERRLREYAASEWGGIWNNECFLVQVKVIRVFDALKFFARLHPDADFVLTVTGDVLSESQKPHTYLIRHGQCSLCPSVESAQHSCSVEELPNILFPQGGPYMRLMLN